MWTSKSATNAKKLFASLQVSQFLNEHQENGCTTHLLPIGQSHRVPCDFPECPRVDPVTHTCSGCSSTFCLSHRHQTDHHCSRLQGLLLQKQSENAKREQLRQEIALKHGAQQAPSSSQPPVSKQEKQLAAEKRAQNAKEALALAKARAASRNAASSSSSSSTSSESPASLSSKPKPKTASRYVAVMKLKKSALSWSIGRALDYIVNLLNLSQAKEISLDAEKRLTIFHAKEAGDIPAALTMQSCLGDLKQIEDGDLFFMAPADWSWA
ncbi:hypothetical protein BGW38_005040 [Lunasporangiospora selenospora]|uniref:AN1-type domain-containing protein n=1 Tax=Lunasporangiospora selenospora TaxID=979761 RepID=A0A9P6G528_9FUNG|nr:hypothetical protein BGW38_005040 [Lunasporangiospora selenospora]